MGFVTVAATRRMEVIFHVVFVVNCVHTYGKGMCKYDVEVGRDTFVVIWDIQ